MRPVLLCLHGWGGSKESFDPLKAELRHADLTILTPDLPGSGEEPEPKQPWSVDDYAAWVESWLKRRDVLGPVAVLGHSHGGRIALKLATRGHLPIHHLYLCAAAGIRHPRHIKRIIGLLLAKTGKFFLSIPGFNRLQPVAKKFLYKLVRVHDYESASPIMRETLMRVTAENLRPLLPTITLPTVIFWGEDDTMTPVADGYVMYKAMKKSRLYTYPGVRHAVHKDKAHDIAHIIERDLE